MKRIFLVFLLSAVTALPQVADKANAGYRTKEGRERVARKLGAHDRDTQQKPDELIAAIGIRPGMTAADIGTGIGYMLPFLSRAVGSGGRVIAEDIFTDFLEQAKATAREKNLANVEFVHGTTKGAELPADSVDVALVLDAYHHFDYPEAMLASIRSSLRKGGRIVIVDFYKEGFGDPDHIRLDEADVIKEVEANGFRFVSRREHMPKRQYMAVFEKK